MGKHVFVSYSRKDAQVAGEVVGELRAAGFSVWQDVSDIRGGDNWLDSIHRGLVDAAAVVVIWSANSAVSQWVKHEIQIAAVQTPTLKIIPLLVDDTPLTPDLTLANAIKLSQDKRQAMTRLIQALPKDIRRHGVGFLPGKLLGDQTIDRTLDLDGVELVWVPLIVSSYCKAAVVGTRDTVLNRFDTIQLSIQVSGHIKDPFIASIYQHVRAAQETGSPIKFAAIHVTGPLHDVRNEYWLDTGNPAHWIDTIDTTYEAVVEISEARRPALQIFSRLPIPMAFGMGTKFSRFWNVQLYHFSDQRYVPVLNILPQRD